MVRIQRKFPKIYIFLNFYTYKYQSRKQEDLSFTRIFPFKLLSENCPVLEKLIGIDTFKDILKGHIMERMYFRFFYNTLNKICLPRGGRGRYLNVDFLNKLLPLWSQAFGQSWLCHATSFMCLDYKNYKFYLYINLLL